MTNELMSLDGTLSFVWNGKVPMTIAKMTHIDESHRLVFKCLADLITVDCFVWRMYAVIMPHR